MSAREQGLALPWEPGGPSAWNPVAPVPVPMRAAAACTPMAPVGAGVARAPAAFASLALWPYLPARDHTLSKRFYEELGFCLVEDDAREGLALFAHGPTRFYLRDARQVPCADLDPGMMQLRVVDALAWWHHVLAMGLARRYGVLLEQPQAQPGGGLAFGLTDPGGVVWRVVQALTRRTRRTEARA